METFNSELQGILKTARTTPAPDAKGMAPEEYERFLGQRVDAERSFRNGNIPARHAAKLELRKTVTGPSADLYHILKGKLGSGLIIPLLGHRGVGKTQIAVWLLRDAADAGKTVRYVKALDLFQELRRTFQKNYSGPDEVTLMNQYARYGVLVIDEAQERGETEFENRTLTNIIDRRYDAMRDTILIGNSTPEEFAKSMGSSVVDRIRECGIGKIKLDWPSFRDGGAQ